MYTNEALSLVQWANVTDLQCNDPSFPCLESGVEVLEHFNFSPFHFTFDIMNMLLIYGSFHILGMVALIRRSRT